MCSPKTSCNVRGGSSGTAGRGKGGGDDGGAGGGAAAAAASPRPPQVESSPAEAVTKGASLGAGAPHGAVIAEDRPSPPPNAPLSVRRPFRHLRLVDDPVVLACALTWKLTDAERDQRARDAEHDVSNGGVSHGVNLRCIRDDAGEDPLQSGARGFGERLFLGRHTDWLRATSEVRGEARTRALPPLRALRPSPHTWQHRR
eukprot:5076279-Prymnesium_polylepis.1